MSHISLIEQDIIAYVSWPIRNSIVIFLLTFFFNLSLPPYFGRNEGAVRCITNSFPAVLGSHLCMPLQLEYEHRSNVKSNFLIWFSSNFHLETTIVLQCEIIQVGKNKGWSRFLISDSVALKLPSLSALAHIDSSTSYV